MDLTLKNLTSLEEFSTWDKKVMEIKLAACGWGAFQGCASPPFFTQGWVLSASFCLFVVLRIEVKSVWLVRELFLEGNNSLELEKVFTQVGSVSISFSL